MKLMLSSIPVWWCRRKQTNFSKMLLEKKIFFFFISKLCG